ncbi:hypothetical protein [Marinococcus luteus]|uniref:hypothetical protein n=1 Tax=Marinococcus luteus TaxID=1122204 RepID=UPI002ACCE3A4|nr:hypothetical protein [Marinococcus luteus]MDZ5781881.1 hypothetical protein [Marinococcus luteus]
MEIAMLKEKAKKMAMNYEKLYFIEIFIKNEIVENTEGLKSLYFHELIPLLDREIYEEEFRKKLYKLIKVRNKICHMKDLGQEDELVLNDCYKEMIKRLNSC